MAERNDDREELRTEYRDGCGATDLSSSQRAADVVPDSAYVYRNGCEQAFPATPNVAVPDNEPLVDTPLSTVVDHLSELLAAFADRLETEHLDALVESTGESRDMVRGDIAAIRAASNPSYLERWLTVGEDLRSSLCTWTQKEDYRVTARPLGRGVNVNAGHNLSAVVFPEIWRALTKNAVLHKIPSGNSRGLKALRDVYDEHSNPVTDTCAVGYWPGGSTDLEQHLFATDYVMAWGDDATISAIRSEVAPTTAFVPFHFEFGAYLVDEAFQRDCNRAGLERIAADFSWGDQLLCYSPLVMLVEQSDATDGFLRRFADALEQYRDTYEMGSVPDRERRKIARSKKTARQSGRLVSEWDYATTVVRKDGLDPSDTQEFHSFRFVRAHTVESLEAGVRTLGPNRHLQDFLVAVADDDKKARLRDVVATTEANRIAPPGGAMPDSPIPWDGKEPLGRLVSRVTDET